MFKHISWKYKYIVKPLRAFKSKIEEVFYYFYLFHFIYRIIF